MLAHAQQQQCARRKPLVAPCRKRSAPHFSAPLPMTVLARSHHDGLASQLARAVATRALQRAPVGEDAIRSSDLGAFGSEWETQLRRTIFDQETQWAMSSGRKPFWGLTESDLDTLEGVKLHKDAVSSAWALLAKARSDLEIAKKRGDPKAMAVSAVGIASGYRPARTVDLSAWKNAYASTYGSMYKARKAQGHEADPFTKQETSTLLVKMINNKAVPGFSNHSRGTAIDFSTTIGKRTLGPDHSDSPAWKDSWFYNWLMTNAFKFGWDPYSKEEWHFDFKELTPETYRACWCGTPEAHAH
jgi:hypothetical protein